ncbi:MAG: hypothetical protein ACLQU3_29285 [Limisphaerales bacterium]
MNDETQGDNERSSKGLLGVSLCWLAVVVVLYIMSIGPAMMIADKMNISNPQPAAQFFTTFYKPIEWAYANTLLHKPIGLYYHLWVPSVIDSHGNIIRGS